MDVVRVLRIIEYAGPRKVVEEQIARSLHGEKRIDHTGLTIRVATIGNYPEILEKELEDDG